MSKKFTVVITIFVILIGFLLFVNLKSLEVSKPQIVPEKKINTHSTYSASLYLMPNPIIATASKSASLNVILAGNLPEKGTMLLQIELAYDPLSLLSVNVIPGDYFTDPEVTLNNIDFRTGRISYAIKGTRAQTGTNNVAQVNFRVSNYGILRQTEMKYLAKTLIHADNEVVNLAKTTGTNIVIKPLLFQYIPFASLSAGLNPKP